MDPSQEAVLKTMEDELAALRENEKRLRAKLDDQLTINKNIVAQLVRRDTKILDLEGRMQRLMRSYVDTPLTADELTPQSEREIVWKRTIEEERKRADLAEAALNHIGRAQAGQ